MGLDQHHGSGFASSSVWGPAPALSHGSPTLTPTVSLAGLLAGSTTPLAFPAGWNTYFDVHNGNRNVNTNSFGRAEAVPNRNGNGLPIPIPDALLAQVADLAAAMRQEE